VDRDLKRGQDLNLNTVLLTGVLGLCAWTLYTVSGQTAIQAGQAEKLNNHEKAISALQVSIANCEADLITLKIKFAKELEDYEKDERKSNSH